MNKAGLNVEVQKPLPLIYNEINLEVGYRIDLFVENELIIELKSVESLNDLHLAQVLTYLKLSLGLLVMAIAIGLEAIRHLQNPPETILSLPMLVVA
ncbi:GxxExxY protein, partial [Arthrospira platensis SPKY2]